MDTNISNEELEKMIENALNSKVTNNINTKNEYVDERAEAFINMLKGMVK